MKHERHHGFFDLSERRAKLTQMGDSLVGLNGQICCRRPQTDPHNAPIDQHICSQKSASTG